MVSLVIFGDAIMFGNLGIETAFSVLDNRHCADICTICQKCQSEVRRGLQVLLLQSEAEDMNCKRVDSATLKYLLIELK